MTINELEVVIILKIKNNVIPIIMENGIVLEILNLFNSIVRKILNKGKIAIKYEPSSSVNVRLSMLKSVKRNVDSSRYVIKKRISYDNVSLAKSTFTTKAFFIVKNKTIFNLSSNFPVLSTL
ncbi:MAG: hypothetical protein O9302_15300 [Cyclobacteriaceae bacterium]|jgi:hypothetical protein|nr:hypothetical protein [Cytophagales bacterium]MCZ8329429.1 hypothetical protein [Cyclobacteriaceae bacterium]